MDFIKLLGPPMKKETTLGGNEQLVYESTEIKSLTFPRGYRAKFFSIRKWTKPSRSSLKTESSRINDS
jgi:hypothetical protein